MKNPFRKEPRRYTDGRTVEEVEAASAKLEARLIAVGNALGIKAATDYSGMTWASLGPTIYRLVDIVEQIAKRSDASL